MTTPQQRAADAALDAWCINARVTSLLVQSLPRAVWALALPHTPRRTVRSIAAHLHNCRRLWVQSLGKAAAVSLPPRVDQDAVSRRDLLKALRVSEHAISLMLQAGQVNHGRMPGVASAFVYGAMPRDVILFTGYALSHEAHHRGQLLLMARELGHRLPTEAVAGLWQWSSRLREAGRRRGRMGIPCNPFAQA